MAILLLPRHLYAFQRAAEEAGDALDVAVAIGVDPLTMLASQAITRSITTSWRSPVRCTAHRCRS